MSPVTLQDAQNRLAEIIANLPPGEEVVITHDDTPVATLRAIPAGVAPSHRRLGTMKGTVSRMAADFDVIPEGFEEYAE
jgi:antitoxin (DNA-binding transcriptional repressor) of toxin-antitoxin stability system